MRCGFLVQGQTDSLARKYCNELVVVVIRQVVAHQDRVVIGYRDPTGIQSPVVPTTQADTVAGVVAAV